MGLCKDIVDSMLSLGKVMLKSKAVKREKRESADTALPLIVMGNGPSLRDTISNDLPRLMKGDRMAVNFAANADEYRTLKPRHYILADPHFFTGEEKDPNVGRLWRNLAETSWEMTLHIPAHTRKAFGASHGKLLPKNVTVEYFNMTPAEGLDAVTHLLFDKNLAMPRPRNVLIPALMQGIATGYKDIYIVGADHTWPHSLYVDDRNRVVSVQPHFYKDNEKELDRVAQEYAGIRIYQVLDSMAVAFRSYLDINRYAEKKGVRIFNSTPGSLIDAFVRQPLPD